MKNLKSSRVDYLTGRFLEMAEMMLDDNYSEEEVWQALANATNEEREGDA